MVAEEVTAVGDGVAQDESQESHENHHQQEH